EGDLRRDEATFRLTGQLVERFLAPTGRVLPDRVTAHACAVEWPQQDLPTRLRELRSEVEAMRGRFGLAFEPVLEDLGRPPQPGWCPAGRADGGLERDGARLLGRPEEFHRLESGRGFEPLPKSLRVQIGSPGTLTGVLFRQSLAFGDDVFAEHESLGWV